MEKNRREFLKMIAAGAAGATAGTAGAPGQAGAAAGAVGVAGGAGIGGDPGVAGGAGSPTPRSCDGRSSPGTIRCFVRIVIKSRRRSSGKTL